MSEFFFRQPGERITVRNPPHSNSLTYWTGDFLCDGDVVKFVRYSVDGTPIVADKEGGEWAVSHHWIEGGA